MSNHDERYNGWTNYETWNCALWLGNEEGSVNLIEEQAREIVKDKQGDYDNEPEIRNEATQELARFIEAMIDEAVPATTGMFADILNAALQRIDYHDIARHYVDEVDIELEQDE